MGEQTLCWSKLRRDALDETILAELGGENKAETTLTELYTLMEQQKDGRPGTLLVDGTWNVFYIRDLQGVLRAVFVYWYDGGWSVGADSVGDPDGWCAGYRVFSRRSGALVQSEPSAA